LIAIFAVIFVLQLTSTIVQYYQSSSLFIVTMQQRAAVSATQVYSDIINRLNNFNAPADKKNFFSVYAGLRGSVIFPVLLNQVHDLQSIHFVDADGKIIAGDDSGKLFDQKTIKLIANEKIGSTEIGDKVVAFVPFTSGNDYMGGLVFSFSDQSIRKEGMALLLRSLLSLLIFLTIGFLATLLISRQITKPLKNLLKGAEEITEGNLNYLVKNDSDDEIGQLALVFNRMAGRLAAYTGKLKKKVAERTQSLDKKVKELSESNIKLKETQVEMAKLIKESQVLGEELKEERDQAKAIVTCMGDSLIVTDKEGKIVSFNLEAGWRLGLTEKETIGKNISESVPLYSDKDCKIKILADDYPTAKALKQGKILISSLADDCYCQIRSGKKIAIVYSASPLLKEGKVLGSVTILRDVTREKQLDEAKNGFISIASHQLRTPLTSMRWFSEMLMSGDAGAINKEQVKFVERIYQGTERMIGLVNMLLQIARVEAGRLKIKPELIDFDNTIRGVEITLKVQLKEKKQRIKLVFNPNPFPKIMMDQEVIWQVFHNLLSNASRYAPKNSLITIAAKENGAFAEFSVTDKGIGIPDDAKDRVFNKFFRAENALKLVPEGSGLGLSLVKSLVEGWNGRVWFESKKGKGTTFYFTVPLSGMKAREGEVSLAV